VQRETRRRRFYERFYNEGNFCKDKSFIHYLHKIRVVFKDMAAFCICIIENVKVL
jgi:hypothetical protein